MEVLTNLQTVEDGAILHSGAGYENIVNKEGFVRIFDYNQGAVPQVLFPRLDDNGGILEITVTNGGENYNDLDKNTSVIYILNEFNDFEHDGYGFLSNLLSVSDSVVTTMRLRRQEENELNSYLIPVGQDEYGIWKSTEDPEIQVSVENSVSSAKNS